MTKNEVLEHLQGLGFAESEARAYLALLEGGTLTGYQLARAAGIPRPNIYPVLDRLQARGIVNRVEVKDGARYVALPAEEMLDRLGRNMSSRIQEARSALKDLGEAASPEQVWNLHGYAPVIDRARSMIGRAEARIIVGNWSNEAAGLAQAMSEAEARGVQVTTLCIQACPQECGGCRGEIYRYPVAPETAGRWLVLSVDNEELLVAEITPDGEATAAVTRLGVLVSLSSQYLTNAIAAAEIARSLGPGMIGMLDGRARRALEGAGLAAGGSSWIERILKAVGAAP